MVCSDIILTYSSSKSLPFSPSCCWLLLSTREMGGERVRFFSRLSVNLGIGVPWAVIFVGWRAETFANWSKNLKYREILLFSSDLDLVCFVFLINWGLCSVEISKHFHTVPALVVTWNRKQNTTKNKKGFSIRLCWYLTEVAVRPKRGKMACATWMYYEDKLWQSATSWKEKAVLAGERGKPSEIYHLPWGVGHRTPPPQTLMALLKTAACGLARSLPPTPTTPLPPPSHR